MLTFWPVVRDDTKVVSVATLATIVVLHTLLAVGCKVGEGAPRGGAGHKQNTKSPPSLSAVLLPDSRLHTGTGSHIPPSSHDIDDQTPLTTGRAYIQGAPH